jgi:hypothetical protein
MTLTNMDGAAFIVAEDAIASVAAGWTLDRRFAIPPSIPREATYTLTFEIISTGTATAILGIDNLDVVTLPSVPGDVNGDGCVNIDDLLEVVGAWGPCPLSPPAPPCAPDIVPTGTVDIDDLLLVISSWGGC